MVPRRGPNPSHGLHRPRPGRIPLVRLRPRVARRRGVQRAPERHRAALEAVLRPPIRQPLLDQAGRLHHFGVGPDLHRALEAAGRQLRLLPRVPRRRRRLRGPLGQARTQTDALPGSPLGRHLGDGLRPSGHLLALLRGAPPDGRRDLRGRARGLRPGLRVRRSLVARLPRSRRAVLLRSRDHGPHDLRLPAPLMARPLLRHLGRHSPLHLCAAARPRVPAVAAHRGKAR